jgi:hypothetical protein
MSFVVELIYNIEINLVFFVWAQVILININFLVFTKFKN